MKRVILIISILLFFTHSINAQLVKSRSRTRTTHTYTQPIQQPAAEQQPIQETPANIKQDSNWKGSLGFRLGIFSGVEYLAYYTSSPILQFGFGAALGTAWGDFITTPELSVKFNLTPNKKINLYTACNLGLHTYWGWGEVYPTVAPELGIDINGARMDMFVSISAPIEIGDSVCPFATWGLRF